MKHLLPLFVLLTLAAPLDTLACSCARPEMPPAAVDNATRVFLGTVTAIEPGETPYEQRVTFQVEEHFKGAPADTVEVDVMRHGAMCGIPFQEHLAYVVYAHGEEGDLGTSSCSRTRLATESGDLEYLRAAD